MDDVHDGGYGQIALQAWQPMKELIARRSWAGKLTEVSINGPKDVWVRVAGKGYVKADARDAQFATREWMERICGYFAAKNGIRWEARKPIIACRTPEGHRFQAITGSNVKSGMSASIRIKRIIGATYDDFEVAPEWRDMIDEAVAAGTNMLILGGTGSGKTTFLNMLLKKVDIRKRPMTIEDTYELDLSHFPNHVCYLVSRTEADTQVGMADMIDNALRQNPTLLLVGELSISNAFAAMQVLDTGHEGMMMTEHSNSPLDGLRGWARRVFLSGAVAGGVREEDLISFLASNLGLIVQIKHFETKENTERRVVTHCVRPMDVLRDMTPLSLMKPATLGPEDSCRTAAE